MKADLLRAAAAMLALLAPLSVVSAQEFQYANQTAQNTPITLVGCGDTCCNNGCCNSGCCDSGCCDNGCCNSGCCDSCCNDLFCNSCCDDGCGGWTVGFDVEATFMQYRQSGGVGMAATVGRFDYDFAPRFIVDVTNCDGFGGRVRYWDYSDASVLVPGTTVLAIDTHNLDVELFQTFSVTRCTSIEVSAGLRWNNFGQTNTNAAGANLLVANVDSIGGTFGLEARRTLGCYGGVYARGRWSILAGDYRVGGTNAAGVPAAGRVFPSNTIMQMELGMGYEFSYALANGSVLRLNAGLEWQQYEDVVFVDDQFGIGNNDNLANAGFAGFVIGAGFDY